MQLMPILWRVADSDDLWTLLLLLDYYDIIIIIMHSKCFVNG